MVAFFFKKRTLNKGYGKFDLIIDLQTKFRNSLNLKEFHIIHFIQELLMVFFHQKK